MQTARGSSPTTTPMPGWRSGSLASAGSPSIRPRGAAGSAATTRSHRPPRLRWPHCVVVSSRSRAARSRTGGPTSATSARRERWGAGRRRSSASCSCSQRSGLPRSGWARQSCDALDTCLAILAASRRRVVGSLSFLRDQGAAVPRNPTLVTLQDAVYRELGLDGRAYAIAAARARFGPPHTAEQGAASARSELRRLLRAARSELSLWARFRGFVSLRSLRSAGTP